MNEKREKYTFSGQFLRGGVKAHQGDWGTSAGKKIQRWKRGALGAKAGGEKIHMYSNAITVCVIFVRPSRCSCRPGYKRAHEAVQVYAHNK